MPGWLTLTKASAATLPRQSARKHLQAGEWACTRAKSMTTPVKSAQQFGSQTDQVWRQIKPGWSYQTAKLYFMGLRHMSHQISAIFLASISAAHTEGMMISSNKRCVLFLWSWVTQSFPSCCYTWSNHLRKLPLQIPDNDHCPCQASCTHLNYQYTRLLWVFWEEDHLDSRASAKWSLQEIKLTATFLRMARMSWVILPR